eukprot:1193852-Prorocentrum_minimum.AAC.1
MPNALMPYAPRGRPLQRVEPALAACGAQDVGETLPQLVVRTMKQTSKPTAIDFHPSSPSFLLSAQIRPPSDPLLTQ